MIAGIDTDVLIHWMMEGTPHHSLVRQYIEREIKGQNFKIGLTQQTLLEFIHIATDPKRFKNPLSMNKAISVCRDLWEGKEVFRLSPGPEVLLRSLELLTSLKLGRKRILDTSLAATLEAAQVKRLVTLNAGDFKIFSFLEVVSPF